MSHPRRFVLWAKEVGEPDSSAWPESYHQRCLDPEAEGRRLIEYFNETLRPGERPREFVRVELDAGDAELAHDWRKTNLVTVAAKRGFGTWDEYRCADCGATGKRFTIGGNVVLDKRFKKLVSCPGPPKTTRRIPYRPKETK